MAGNEGLPPSYTYAVTRVDPFALICPEIPFTLVPVLVQVSKRLRRIFLPVLWRDPLRSVRRLGRDPYQDIQWLQDLAKKLPTFTASLRETISVLDLRDFATRDVALSASDDVSLTLASLILWMPNLNSVIVGPDTRFDLNVVLPTVPRLRLLSLQDPGFEVSANMFAQLDPSSLAYFEMSSAPGKKLNLPGIEGVRIFKLRKSRVADIDAVTVVSALSMYRKVWSLDLSHNNISDDAIIQMMDFLFLDLAIRSNAHFFSEGRLVNPSLRGHVNFGPFEVIHESRDSCTFNHEARYFVDSPSYVSEDSENTVVRNNGISEPLDDSLEFLNDVLSKPEGDTRSPPQVLTHLNLSQNNITSLGLEKLLRTSRGFLEVLSCSGTKVYATGKSIGAWKSNSSLYGVFGAAQLVRPVYSSNLRRLTIHHSLVTQIPSLVSADHSGYAALYLAEQVLLPQVQLMYPQGQYKPDMNTRLTSLTLTSVPRRSTGSLVKALIDFLDLLATQERAIKYHTESSTRRAPPMVRGLRSLRLEFETDPLSDMSEHGLSLDLDIQGLIDTTKDFTFFPSQSSQPSASPSTATPAPAPSKLSHEAAKQAAREATRALRLGATPHRPRTMKSPEPQSQHDRYITFSSQWLDKSYTTKVWAGRAPSDPMDAAQVSPAVHAYTHAVMNPALQKIPGPASSVQIRAGVPDGALIFHDAWEAAALPEARLTSLSETQEKDARAMVDVVLELRKYRQSKKSNGWSGNLSVVLPSTN
ncbi:hypothetical protein BROUX41_005361 [Berkeleyomyces rouxiae]|uniref:uncharacterized protein n=1 Tax=Berkeleyomyces rouxiae TaxID=2035830 RepID=UPI003B7950BE